MEKITPNDFLAVSEKLKDAQNDTTPFAIVEDKEIKVVGDANKTAVKKNNYMVKFRFPKGVFEQMPEGAKEVGNFYVLEVEYKDVSITPRTDLKIVDAIFRLQPFLNELTENGAVKERAPEELFHIFAYASEDIHLAMYNIVGAFLGIDDKMGEYMLPFSVLDTITKLIETHPEVFNEADVFFG